MINLIDVAFKVPVLATDYGAAVVDGCRLQGAVANYLIYLAAGIFHTLPSLSGGLPSHRYPQHKAFVALQHQYSLVNLFWPPATIYLISRNRLERVIPSIKHSTHDILPRLVADWFRVIVGTRNKGHHSEEHSIVIDFAAATLGDTFKVRESGALTIPLDDCVVTLFFFVGLGQGENSPRH
jgi:hypothetical protein